MMKLLLHCCCGPCAGSVLSALSQEGLELTGYFYNPNIHPYTEHQSRRRSWLGLMEEEGLPHIDDDSYGLEEWLKNAAPDPGNRCAYCYRERLEKTAATAARLGLGAFTTTLLVSPYQKHELIRAEAEKAALKYRVSFFYRDFRPLFREGQNLARQKGLYMQKYCGCIYSEKERYLK